MPELPRTTAVGHTYLARFAEVGEFDSKRLQFSGSPGLQRGPSFPNVSSQPA